MSDDPVLVGLGPRLRVVRQQRRTTLSQLSAATGISVSTLSRLESGQRKPTLELLLPLARAHRLSLDDLIGAPPTGDPRIRPRPIQHHGRTMIPLSQQPGGLRAYKMIIPPSQEVPDLRTHEGYEWLYVLTGKLRLCLGQLELVMSTGEAAEFDTRTPHWFGSAGSRAVELLTLFGPQGERMHVRARGRKS